MSAWLNQVKGLLPYIVAVPLIFLAGVMWDGDRRERDISQRVVKNFSEYAMVRALEAMADKGSLLEEIANERRIQAEWLTRFDRILTASDQERASFRIELAASGRRIREATARADETMRRLDDARRSMESAWLDGRIPADVTCGVLHTPGCPDLSRPAAPAPADRGVVLPGRPAGDAGADRAGSGAAMPPASGN